MKNSVFAIIFGMLTDDDMQDLLEKTLELETLEQKDLFVMEDDSGNGPVVDVLDQSKSLSGSMSSSPMSFHQCERLELGFSL